MPTTFIAVQCYQCSTMQVKQQKKSSNKWSCVVCNEKQSVRKVYAQAFMAKEVRKFVQNFNMSRQFAEETTQTPQEIEEDHHQILDDRDKKRTDWSEYINPEDEKANENDDDDQGDEFEPEVVTELPNALFKKPKLNNYCGSSDGRDGKKAFKPIFGKRKNIRQSSSQALELSGYHHTVAKEICDNYTVQKEDLFPGMECVKVQLTEGVSKWRPNGIRNDDDRSGNQEPMRRQLSNINGVSKWSEYIIEDDDDGGDVGGCLGLGSGRDLVDHPTMVGEVCGDYKMQKEDSFLGKESAKIQLVEGVSKWRFYGIRNDNDRSGNREPMRRQLSNTKAASKWSEYVTEDDDDGGDVGGCPGYGGGRDLVDHPGNWNSDAFELASEDQRVEEDVHPDFL